jgi:hypothetical protein
VAKRNGAPRKPRPDYWTPEWVAEQFRAGKKVPQICAEVAQDAHLSVPSLRRDVTRWRNELPEFSQLYDETHAWLLQKGPNPKFDAREKERLLRAMTRQGGNFKKAIEECQIKPGLVLSAMDPRSPRYDAEFVHQFNVAEGERAMELYDAYWDEATTLRGRDDPRRNGLVLTRLGESRLGAHTPRARKSAGAMGSPHSGISCGSTSPVP